MTYKEIIGKVAEDTGLSKHIVDRTWRAYWRVIREHITALPLKKDLTDDEFLQLQPNVNIPSIGKLNVSLDRYKGMKKRYKILKELQQRNAAHKEDTSPED